MGFTRTTEGRVFFKGANNDDAPRFETPSSPSEPVMNVDQTQMQILLLLKSLNTKLKNSKEEQAAMKKQLAAYKTSLKQIREKTGSYETNYIDLEQQVSRKQTEAQKQVTRVEDTLKDTLKQLEEARKLVEELESKTETSVETLESLKNSVEERKKEEEKLLQRQKELESKAEGSFETLELLKNSVEERKKEEEKILKRQKELEKSHTSQGEKMVDSVAAYVALTKRVSESEARQATLDNKIEENTSEYLKLDRKIDKAVEDRNRILRKIERIEAAVMETRDALNAKAMVLLTQQGNTPTAMEYPQIADDAPPTTPQSEQQENPTTEWWGKSVRLNMATFAALLLAVLAIGWIISALVSNLGTAEPEAGTLQDQGKIVRQSMLDTPPPQEKISSTEPRALNTERSNDYSTQTDDEPKTFAEAKALPPPEDYGITIHKGSAGEDTPKETADIDINNDSQTLAMMEKAPDKVAAELNKIEPTTYTPPTKEQPKQIGIEPPAKVITAPPPERVGSASESYKAGLKSRLKPDSNLTDVAKRIEAQAFDGVPEAQHDMGAIYVAGHGPIKQDLKRAVFWFTEAANNGIANAQYNLGVLYHQGMGVDKDIAKAIQLYQKAADQGHPEAEYNLGIANIEGIGVAYNPQKAAVYFENAANRNIVEAAYNLGLIYENGLLGETHPDEALMWYKTAADNGSPEAKAALEQLANSLGIAMSDVNRVVEKTRKTKTGATAEPDQDSQQQITGGIQKELMARGLYPGPVDGMNGPMTANAIKNFQSAANLAADGIPSKDLLSYMRTNRN